MVTAQHEAMHRIFREDVELFARVMLRVFGVAVGESVEVTLLDSELTEIEPLERRADTVILAEFMVADSTGRFILVVESQTDPDPEKEWSWPYYIAYLRARYRHPVVLLVVCNKAATAKWARTTIVSGLPDLICMWVQPVVLGPDNVPTITDLSQARQDVGFTVFSALTHSRSEQAHDILGVLAEALTTTDEKNAAFLTRFIEYGLAGNSSQEIWRALMRTYKYPYVTEIEAQGIEQGIEQGIAIGEVKKVREIILRILARRSIEVPADRKVTIEECTDLDKLETWIDRAQTIDDIADLFV